jgi:hypothetical protein
MMTMTIIDRLPLVYQLFRLKALLVGYGCIESNVFTYGNHRSTNKQGYLDEAP